MQHRQLFVVIALMVAIAMKQTHAQFGIGLLTSPQKLLANAGKVSFTGTANDAGSFFGKSGLSSAASFGGGGGGGGGVGVGGGVGFDGLQAGGSAQIPQNPFVNAKVQGGVNLSQDQQQGGQPTTNNRFGGGFGFGSGGGGGGGGGGGSGGFSGGFGFGSGGASASLGGGVGGGGGSARLDLSTPAVNALETGLQQEWSSFKNLFNKTYNTPEEESYRREVFIENRNKVARFNQDYGNGLSTFVQKLNRYADLLHHEFHNLVNGFNRSRGSRNRGGSGRGSNGAPGGGDENQQNQQGQGGSAFIPSANVIFPSYVDWREAGAVSSVKSQGTCGACYAFSATGALEGHYFRKTGKLVELSPQNLIDCTRPYGNDGCTGGLMSPSFEYARDNRGVDTEGSYPFEEKDDQQCRYRREGYGAHDTGYVDLDEGDERGLEAAIATLGPVSSAIDAAPESFQFYSNGIYYDSSCNSAADKMNHAVLVVGYGTEPTGEQYWMIKNSYGPDWGIGGYMKLAKFRNNHCGIATYASYPLV